jgi:fido (protein-threonine AMPylation protein)
MSRYSSHDPYVDPATGVLRNRFGLTDEQELEAAEASLSALRSYELAQNPLVGAFDLAHLQSLHRYLFGDLYEWAGQLRTIDITRGRNSFAHHAYIVSAGAALFGELAKEQHLAGLDPERFSARAGHYLGEINALHPFRDGNGRAQREFTSHLAAKCGYYIAWEVVTREQMLEASIESFEGSAAKLVRIIRSSLSARDRDT